MRMHNCTEHDSALNEQDRTIHLDIGGGPHAGYFHKLARNNRDQLYLVLDPAIEHPPRDCPPNLQLIKWRSDNDGEARSYLPVKARSVDTAHLSFLLGELRGRSVPAYAEDPHYYTRDAELERYRHLLHGLKHALKPGGRVHISEPQDNILLVQDLFKQEGFAIVQRPTMIEDKHQTAWINAFYHIVDQGGEPKTASPALPMELVTTF